MKYTRNKGKNHCRLKAMKAESGYDVDYKDLSVLKNYITETGKIIPNRITRTQPISQRRVAKAIKMARFLGLLAFCEHKNA